AGGRSRGFANLTRCQFNFTFPKVALRSQHHYEPKVHSAVTSLWFLGQPRPQEAQMSANPISNDIVQPYGHVTNTRIGLSAGIRYRGVASLTRMLAHTLAVRDLYKKAHWQTYGTTFYQLHLLFDKHASAQTELADALAERVQLLGGVSLALAADVVEETRIARAPRGIESVPVQLQRLCDAHEMILTEARDLARR